MSLDSRQRCLLSSDASLLISSSSSIGHVSVSFPGTHTDLPLLSDVPHVPRIPATTTTPSLLPSFVAGSGISQLPGSSLVEIATTFIKSSPGTWGRATSPHPRMVVQDLTSRCYLPKIGCRHHHVESLFYSSSTCNVISWILVAS